MNRGYRQPSIYSRTKDLEKPPKSKRGVFLVLFLFLIIGVLIYLVFFSSIFRLNKTEITTTKYLDRNKLETVISDYEKKSIFTDNLLTLSKSNMAKTIMTISGVESVNIEKIYLHKIKISVVERAPIFVWQVSDKKYLVDKTGLIWGVYEEKYKDKPVVIDLKNVPTAVGSKPVSTLFSRFIEELNRDFVTITGKKIVKIEVVDTTNEIKVYSNATWYAYLDTTKTVRNQLINLSRILEDVKKNAPSKNLEYIDLRLDNKIFYK